MGFWDIILGKNKDSSNKETEQSQSNDNDARIPSKQKCLDFLLPQLRQLEKELGYNTTYEILDPFKVSRGSITSAKKAAKKIWEFVDLPDIDLIIERDTLEGIAGAINLSKLRSHGVVRIKIDNDVMYYPKELLGTLSHEIMHAYRDIHGLGEVYIPHEGEEKLTDITGVFVGLGKLLLEGSENIRDSWEGSFEVKSGHLDLLEVGIVYRLVCAMRNLSVPDIYGGLSPRSTDILLLAEKDISPYLSNEFREQSFASKLAAELKADRNELEHEIASTKSALGKLSEEIIDYVLKEVSKSECLVNDLEEDTKEIREHEVYDPALHYLDMIQFQEKVESNKQEVLKDIESLHSY